MSLSHTTFCCCVEWLNMEPRPSITACAILISPFSSVVGQLLSLALLYEELVQATVLRTMYNDKEKCAQCDQHSPGDLAIE